MNESNAGGKFDEIAGKVKQGVGEAIGNEKLANKGAAEQVKGHAEQTWGNVKDAASDVRDSAKADANAHTTEARTDAHQTGSNLRQDVTSAAEHAKDSISRGVDKLTGKNRS